MIIIPGLRTIVGQLNGGSHSIFTVKNSRFDAELGVNSASSWKVGKTGYLDEDENAFDSIRFNWECDSIGNSSQRKHFAVYSTILPKRDGSTMARIVG
jgi:hypothetical protein